MAMSEALTALKPGEGNFLFSSESVCEGHPDKLCDQISDGILDACLAQDPSSKVACEAAAKSNVIVLLGEISTNAKVDYEQIVRDVAKRIGFDDVSKGLDYKTCEVKLLLKEQATEIADAVHVGKALEEIGSGDQGLMFGYACAETTELMPLSHALAAQLSAKLSELRKSGELPYLRPDGKTQVTVEYERNTNRPIRVHTVLISAQHTPDVKLQTLQEDLLNKCIKAVVPAKYLDDRTRFVINPSGSFTCGGPMSDAGLTGRKIIVDTYGGWGGHGGGAFSGKDSTKVDRSAAYAARWVAKSLVANGFCTRALIQIAYSIGIAEPLSMNIDCFGTMAPGLSETDLDEIVLRNFDLRPGCIIRDLQLTKPIFSSTAVGGHFGRRCDTFPWETPKDLRAEAAKLNLDVTPVAAYFNSDKQNLRIDANAQNSNHEARVKA